MTLARPKKCFSGGLISANSEADALTELLEVLSSREVHADLAGISVESCMEMLEHGGRLQLLSYLGAAGLALPPRQAFANAYARAIRAKQYGDEDVTALVMLMLAGFDGPGVVASTYAWLEELDGDDDDDAMHGASAIPELW